MMKKNEFLRDFLTGLALAVFFGAVAPTDTFAQLSTAVINAQTTIAAPFVTIVSYISYALGTVMTVAGIAQAKKHADAPQQNPLGPALGRLGAGAAFLAAPWLIGTVLATGNNTLNTNGTGTFTSITGFQ